MVGGGRGAAKTQVQEGHMQVVPEEALAQLFSPKGVHPPVEGAWAAGLEGGEPSAGVGALACL